MCSIIVISSFSPQTLKAYVNHPLKNKRNHEKLCMPLEMSLSTGEIDKNTITHRNKINSLYHYIKHIELLCKNTYSLKSNISVII